MTDRRRLAVIVAHGQPSDPDPAEAETAALARRVAALMPDWEVRSATLAQKGALARAAGGATGVVVYPLFMADGWFTQVHLPQRLAEAGARAPRCLAPFGLDPEVQALTVAIAAEAALDPASASLVLAAHGSFRSDAPAAVARAMATKIAAAVAFRRVVTGFIDQDPQIEAVAGGLGPQALCLPFFAARGGHVTDDLPEALGKAGFEGRLLDPVGLHPRVPGLIAAALQA